MTATARAFGKLALAAAAGLALVQCVSPPSVKPSTAEIRRLLPGTWMQTLEEHHRTQVMRKTYFADGTAKGWIHTTLNRGRVTVHLERTNFTSRWRIEGDQIVIFDIESTDTHLAQPGEVLHDRVLAIDKEHVDFIDLSHGGHFALRRMEPF